MLQYIKISFNEEKYQTQVNFHTLAFDYNMSTYRLLQNYKRIECY